MISVDEPTLFPIEPDGQKQRTLISKHEKARSSRKAANSEAQPYHTPMPYLIVDQRNNLKAGTSYTLIQIIGKDIDGVVQHLIMSPGEFERMSSRYWDTFGRIVERERREEVAREVDEAMKDNRWDDDDDD